MKNSSAIGLLLAIRLFFVAGKRLQLSLRTMSLPMRTQPRFLLKRMKQDVLVARASKLFCTPSPTSWQEPKKSWAASTPLQATAITDRACDEAPQQQRRLRIKR